MYRDVKLDSFEDVKRRTLHDLQTFWETSDEKVLPQLVSISLESSKMGKIYFLRQQELNAGGNALEVAYRQLGRRSAWRYSCRQVGLTLFDFGDEVKLGEWRKVGEFVAIIAKIFTMSDLFVARRLAAEILLCQRFEKATGIKVSSPQKFGVYTVFWTCEPFKVPQYVFKTKEGVVSFKEIGSPILPREQRLVASLAYAMFGDDIQWAIATGQWREDLSRKIVSVGR